MMKGNKRLSAYFYTIVLVMAILFCHIGLHPVMAGEVQPPITVNNQQSTAVGNPPAQAAKELPAAEAPVAKAAKDTVVIGLDSPELGPYIKQGQDQIRGAEMAVEEINAAGGILGKQIRMFHRNSKSNPRIAKENAVDLFNKEGASMMLGGVSCAVALTLGKVAKIYEKIFFGTMTYSTDITTEEGHKYIFRESYDSTMAARVLSDYLKKHYPGKQYFYVTVDYNWGWTTEEVFRKYTDTLEKLEHRSFLTKLGTDDFKSVLTLAQDLNTEVLVLVLFGRDMEIAVKQAYEMGLKNKMQIVVPSMTIDMAEGAGPEAMEGILSTTPWYWKLPFEEKNPKGMDLVKKFEEKFNRYPTSAAASAYVTLYQYKEAVERAKTFDTLPVIKTLEDHKYTGLKDEQQWRGFDHQSIQTVFAVKLKKAEEVKKDKYQSDYYEVINRMKGEQAAITKEEWDAARAAVSAPPALEE